MCRTDESTREYFVQDVIESSNLSPVKMNISICLLTNVYSKFNLAVVFFKLFFYNIIIGFIVG